MPVRWLYSALFMQSIILAQRSAISLSCTYAKRSYGVHQFAGGRHEDQMFIDQSKNRHMVVDMMRVVTARCPHYSFGAWWPHCDHAGARFRLQSA